MEIKASSGPAVEDKKKGTTWSLWARTPAVTSSYPSLPYSRVVLWTESLCLY